MEFACDRCQKRFSTSYQPVTGRLYRIPCKCGNDIVLRFDPPRHAGPPLFPPRASSRRTPPPLPDRYLRMANGRARAESTRTAMTVGEFVPARDTTPPVLTWPVPAPPASASPVLTSPVLTFPTNGAAARARLDPTASPEVSGEYPYEPSTSVPFGVAFALSRRRAFVAGCGAGASGAIVLVGAVMLVAWPSGPRSENRVPPAPSVTFASMTEQASAPLAVRNAMVAGDRAAPPVPRRVKQAPRVVAAPLLVEEVAASPTTAVDREAAASEGHDGEDSPASDDGSERAPLAEAKDGEASDGAGAQASEEQGTALDERAVAVTEAPAQGEESSGDPDRIALVPALEPEHTPESAGASGAATEEDRAQ